MPFVKIQFYLRKTTNRKKKKFSFKKKTSLSFYTELIKNIYVFLANNYFDHGNAFKGKEEKNAL